MNENEKNVSVEAQSTEVQRPEVIQDEALLKDWDRAYFKALKKWSWNLVWNNKYGWRFFVIYLIMGWIGLVMSLLDLWLNYSLWIQEDWYSLNLFSSIADIILTVWLFWFAVNIAKWLFQKVGDFFHAITWDRIWKYFVWGLLYGLIVCCGFVLLIIPWIIFSTRFSLFTYAVIDKWYWPIDALKYSWRITKWRFWEIIWLWVYFWLINILWLLCLVVGLIWTSAMTTIASARYYRLLSNLYEKNLKLSNNAQQE